LSNNENKVRELSFLQHLLQIGNAFPPLRACKTAPEFPVIAAHRRIVHEFFLDGEFRTNVRH
jgi:hypothetical protein